MSPPRRLSRRSLLLGALGAALAACGPAGSGSPGRAPAAAGWARRPRAGDARPHLQPGEGWRAAAARPAARAATGAAPVELVWQADGGPDRLGLPTGLAVDRRGVLTVVDAGQRSPRPAGDGRRRRRSPASAAPATPPASSASRRRSTRIQAASARVGGAVAVDGAGALYVADPFNARLQRLDRAGPVVAPWGESPPSIGPLVEPAGIAVDDRRGRVYVADAGAHRVHAFDRDGRWLLAWGGPGQGAGEFLRPAAVAVDRAGAGLRRRPR